jgi:ribosomal protein S12 methylthiotransferase
VDGLDADVAVARSSADAPEIDGTVRIRGGGGKLRPGDWAEVRIVAAGAYDLEAVLSEAGDS